MNAGQGSLRPSYCTRNYSKDKYSASPFNYARWIWPTILRLHICNDNANYHSLFSKSNAYISYLSFVSLLWTFRQAQKVVGMFSVILSLKILMSRGTNGYNNPDGISANTDPKTPFSRFHTFDGFPLADLPCRAIGIRATYMGYAFVRIISVTFVDALNLMVCCHGTPPCFCFGQKLTYQDDYFPINFMQVIAKRQESYSFPSERLEITLPGNSPLLSNISQSSKLK
jgi:hypothetical protein